MSTDGTQRGSPTLWQKVLSQTVQRTEPWPVAPWRVLEGLAVAGLLIWLVSSNSRPNRALDAAQQLAVAKPTAPTAPAFSDPRALIPGTAVITNVPAFPVVTATPSPPPSPKAPAAQSPAQTAPQPAPQPAAPPNRPTQVAANIPPPPSAAAAAPRTNEPCPAPDIRITPAAGGQMQIQIASACRQGQEVGLSYDAVELRRTLPAGGSVSVTLDLFAGDKKSVDVMFADGTRRVLPAVAHDLDKATKIAVRWRAPVNLDLHVFENGATAGQAGHIWTQAPASAAAALAAVQAGGRGHGFLNAFDDGPGDKVEIYTYFHGAKDLGTTVAMALDHETRGSQPTAATCGQGVHAKVEFGITLLSRSGELARAGGTFKPARCDQPLAATERFDYGLMPVIAAKN